MGCYINPPDQTKEEFLAAKGRRVTEADAANPELFTFASPELPVVLIDNGAFTAAGVAYEEEEYECFAYPDGRRKQWYIVSKADLREVCDLDHYI